MSMLNGTAHMLEDVRIAAKFRGEGRVILEGHPSWAKKSISRQKRVSPTYSTEIDLSHLPYTLSTVHLLRPLSTEGQLFLPVLGLTR